VVEVAEFEVLPGQVLVGRLTGCGVQFNQNVFAGITGAEEGSFPDLERKVLALAPQFVRLFYNDKQANASAPDGTMGSFVRSVQLAQQAGATINITWQSGTLGTEEAQESAMSRFAGALGELVSTHGINNLRWVTIQNEPNTPGMKFVTPEVLDAMYRMLDRNLTALGVREQIRFMGGDLIQGSAPPAPNSEEAWFAYMAEHMADVLDAYSVHVYWNYWDTARFVNRLNNVQEIVADLAEDQRKPLFITEYGVRGKRPPGDPGGFPTPTGEPLGQTNLAAFQHAWFLILAAQHGFVGTVKWDCYYGKYDQGTQAYYAIGPAPEWPLYPMYFLLWLVTNTTKAGWRVVEVSRNTTAPTKQLAAFVGEGGEQTILGLDTAGATLNGVSATTNSYTIGGLEPNTDFNFFVWNRDGEGKLVLDRKISADSDGVATVAAPLHAVFALTTSTLTVLPS